MLAITLKWFKENKFYGTVLLILLSAVVYVCFILSQYFFHFSTWETIDTGHQNIYYFTSDNKISLSEFDDFLHDVYNH
jgi:hypothetical protein